MGLSIRRSRYQQRSSPKGGWAMFISKALAQRIERIALEAELPTDAPTLALIEALDAYMGEADLEGSCDDDDDWPSLMGYCGDTVAAKWFGGG